MRFWGSQRYWRPVALRHAIRPAPLIPLYKALWAPAMQSLLQIGLAVRGPPYLTNPCSLLSKR